MVDVGLVDHSRWQHEPVVCGLRIGRVRRVRSLASRHNKRHDERERRDLHQSVFGSYISAQLRTAPDEAVLAEIHGDEIVTGGRRGNSVVPGWEKPYAGSPQVLGRSIRVNARRDSYRVMPEGMEFPMTPPLAAAGMSRARSQPSDFTPARVSAASLTASISPRRRTS